MDVPEHDHPIMELLNPIKIGGSLFSDKSNWNTGSQISEKNAGEWLANNSWLVDRDFQQILLISIVLGSKKRIHTHTLDWF